MLLPALILGPEIKGTRVLEVRWKHDGLVARLPRKLHAKIPGVQGDEGEFQVLGQ